MSNIIQIYKAVKEASQNEALAQVIAEAFDQAESRFPNLAHTATQRDLSETELRLMGEIEKTRLEIKDVELRLTEAIGAVRLDMTKEIESVRTDLTKAIESVRTDLTKEIESVRRDLTKEIESVRTDLTKEMGKQTMRTVSYLTAIMALFYAIIRFVPA